MKRLERPSIYTDAKSHDRRIEQLERRYYTSSTSWALARFSASQSISSGGNVITWDHFYTSAPNIFHTSATIGGDANDTAGDNSIRMLTSGIVLVSGWIQWETGTYYRISVVNASGGETDPITNYADINDRAAWNPTTNDDNGSPQQTHDDQWFQSGDDTIASWFSIQANVAGANMNAISGSLTVILFPASGRLWDNSQVY